MPKSLIQLLRFIIFFVLVIVIAWTASTLLANRQHAIAAFALAVLALSLLMPALCFELDGLWVDTIYYVAAAIAAVMFFIAEEPEQAEIEARKQLDDLQFVREAAEQQLSALEARGADIAARIASNSNRLREIEATMDEEWAQRLLAEEQTVADALFRSLKDFEDFAARAASEAVSCENNRDLLARAWAQIKVEETTRQEDRFPEAVPDRELNMLEAEIDRCNRVAALQSRIEILEPGYPRLIGLIEASKDAFLTAGLPGFEAPSSDILDADRERIEQISELLRLQRLRQSSEFERTRLAAAAADLSSERAAVTRGLQDKDAEITKKKRDLEAAEEQPLAGLALLVKNWMTFRWPYFFIAFLGLKLARKPVFVFRAAKALQQTKSPPG